MRGFFAFALSSLIYFVRATNYHDVKVGEKGLTFDPEYVKAHVGDIVRFTFNPKAHSVTQSNFEKPCVFNGHFDTGLVPVSPDAPGEWRPVMDFHVVDISKPLWFYCRQKDHCGQGMVFAINPPPEGSEKSFSEFKRLAIQQNGTATTTSATPAPTGDATTRCPASDDEGGLLQSTSFEKVGKLTRCDYERAGVCIYFENGTFSQGSSVCPGGLLDVAAPAPAGDATAQCAAAGSVISATVKGGEVVCEFAQIGTCTYFSNGNFSGGSSSCPTQIAAKSNSGIGGSVNTLAGSLSNGDGDENASDMSTLIRNGYIVIGLLAAVVLSFFVLIFVMVFGRNCMKGRPVKYAKVPEIRAYPPEASSSKADLRYNTEY